MRQYLKEVENICRSCGISYTGKKKSMYCSPKCGHKVFYNKNMLDPEWRLKKLLSMAKGRASDLNVPFDLDIEHLLWLWNLNNGHCEVSKIKLELDRSALGKVHPYAPSIDRIVPALGYTKCNVRIICYQANVAISEFGLEQFEKFITLYRNNKDYYVG